MTEEYDNVGCTQSVYIFLNENQIVLSRSLLSDLKSAVKVWPDDQELHLIMETLQVSC